MLARPAQPRLRSVTVAPLPEEGELIDEKYRVEGCLGTGGMAAVYAARHQQLDGRVALKVLLPKWASSALLTERFVNEGRALFRIHDEHVVRVLDVAVSRQRAYLVLEHLTGRDLETHAARRRLPLSEAVDYVAQACEGMSVAHALGIVHRDLKPSNLFLTKRRDGSPCIKVIDFGIATSERPESSGVVRIARRVPTRVVGSPHYMAPEQMCSPVDADARSDIWSLGASLYELLTGEPPFEADTTEALCARALYETARPLSRARPDVPAALEAVVDRCLAKSPADRFASCAELARALRAAVPASRPASVSGAGQEAPATEVLRPVSRLPLRARAQLAPPPRGRIAGYMAGASLLLLVGGGVGWQTESCARAARKDAARTEATLVVPPAPPAPVPSMGLPAPTEGGGVDGFIGPPPPANSVRREAPRGPSPVRAPRRLDRRGGTRVAQEVPSWDAPYGQ